MEEVSFFKEVYGKKLTSILPPGFFKLFFCFSTADVQN
tara:strand:+ start:12 stop:125 length:114 start_codon:yes stop_codon:yes gene_type:complete